MNTQEHLLVVSILAKQLQAIKTVIEILKSRGVLQGDDAQAFGFATSFDLQSNAALFQDVLREYVKYATRLQIATGLERRSLSIPNLLLLMRAALQVVAPDCAGQSWAFSTFPFLNLP